MQESVNIKSIYTKIQKQLFYMIPEKWDKIYLYASITKKLGNLETGEMFFYYFPTGFLKRNPVNSYEIPNRFNIDEQDYLKLINSLYDLIKRSRDELKKQGEKEWSSITIKMERTKFIVEMHYNEKELLNEQEVEAKHILWAYQNLQKPIQSFNKLQRQILIQELQKKQEQNVAIYRENLYCKPIKNIVQYHKEKMQYISEKKEKTKIKLGTLKKKKMIEEVQEVENVKIQILNVGA